MWLEAIVLEDDLAALLAELLPMTVRLGDKGELCISDPTGVALVDGVGVRAMCKAKVHWEVLGLSVPVTVNSVGVLVRPQIAERPGGAAVVFKLELEHTDVAGVPSLLGPTLTDLVNGELAAKHVELSWTYASTLSHTFDLPALLRPFERLELTADGARVKATGSALGLAVEMRARVIRGEKVTASAPVSAAVLPTPRAPARKRPPRVGGIAALGGVGALAMVAAYALGRAR